MFKPKFNIKAMLLAFGLVSGCAQGIQVKSEDSGSKAEKMLERAIAAAENDRLPYRGKTEIFLNGIPAPGSGTGPLQANSPVKAGGNELAGNLALLRQAQRTVTLEKDPNLPGMEVLRVDVNDPDWTERARNGWRKRITSLQTEGNETILKNTTTLPKEKAELVAREMKASLDTARVKMERMVDTLEADGSYRFILKPGEYRPESVEVENRLRYDSEGRKQEETIRTSYRLEATAGQ